MSRMVGSRRALLLRRRVFLVRRRASRVRTASASPPMRPRERYGVRATCRRRTASIAPPCAGNRLITASGSRRSDSWPGGLRQTRALGVRSQPLLSHSTCHTNVPSPEGRVSIIPEGDTKKVRLLSASHDRTPSELPKSAGSTPVAAGELVAFAWPAIVSLCAGVLVLLLGRGWAVPENATVSQVITTLVPGIAGIARYTQNPQAVTLIMASQWVFLPWYLAVWFYKLAPWDKQVRAATIRKSKTLRSPQRVLFVVAYVFLCFYILGELQVVDFATLLNSRFAYPPDKAALLVRPIYDSDVALLIYSWLSPFCEATILWAFANFTLNLPNYLGLHQR
jgi:hypothetical protein